MGHSEGALVGKFCTQRKPKCDKHSQEYRENCKVSWTYQAHHVLCVASVTQYLSVDKDIKPIVEQTDWCINTTENMLAMPTYMGEIARYYEGQLASGADLNAAPGFADIPVHGYGHGGEKGYKSEIDAYMVKLAKAAAKSKEAHKDAAATLAGQLNSYRNTMKPLLKGRGKRGKGTHQEWLDAFSGNPSAKWYMPFSMADDANVKARTFPGYSKATMDKVKALVNNLT